MQCIWHSLISSMQCIWASLISYMRCIWHRPISSMQCKRASLRSSMRCIWHSLISSMRCIWHSLKHLHDSGIVTIQERRVHSHMTIVCQLVRQESSTGQFSISNFSISDFEICSPSFNSLDLPFDLNKYIWILNLCNTIFDFRFRDDWLTLK